MKPKPPDADSMPRMHRTTTIEEDVLERLRTMIVSGDLAGGTLLGQRHIGMLLGVSQTPVRAVLMQLEREGLVEMTPRGTAHVLRMSVDDMEENFVVRGALEGLAARYGAPALTDEYLSEMQQRYATVEQLAEFPERLPAYIRARWEFHAVCYRASGRQRLVTSSHRAFLRGERYNRILLRTSGNVATSLEHYRHFLTACSRRDGDAAERALLVGIEWCMAELRVLVPRLDEAADVGTVGELHA